MKTTDTTKTYLALAADKKTELTKVIKELQIVLANTAWMHSLYKKYHWHVAGEDFYQFHKLFDKHAAEQLPIIDAVAERMRTLGAQAEAMPDDVVRLSTLKEEAPVGHNPQVMLASLLNAHEAYLKQLRVAIEAADDADDEGSEDLLVSEVLRVHELEVWFLRSSLS